METELVYMFITYDYKNYRVHSDEVDEARFWTTNQVYNNLGKGIFTSNFEHEYKILKELKLI